ncbi:unnamed protein product, partial [Brenthis ino]
MATRIILGAKRFFLTPDCVAYCENDFVPDCVIVLVDGYVTDLVDGWGHGDGKDACFEIRCIVRCDAGSAA